jgi:death-on-curing protein
MRPPEFLTLPEVLEIHVNQIELYGGSPGIRDLGLLEAALAQPESTFDGAFLHPDLYEMAAAYIFHLVQNHPFVDGNKRVGTVAAIAFLSINGIEIDAELDKSVIDSKETVLEKIVLAIASGKMQKPELAELFRKNAVS